MELGIFNRVATQPYRIDGVGHTTEQNLDSDRIE